MKKFLSILALLLMPLLATASVVIDGICYELNDDTQEATVTSKEFGYSGDIVIPATITVDSIIYNVTSIGTWTFEDCRSLTSVAIPESVTTIGDEAFEGCSSLASIVWDSPLAVTQGKWGEGVSNNPNALLYVKSAEQVEFDFPGNVVVNGYIENLHLSEGHNFYATRPFTVNDISYTHTYTMQSGRGEARGWETITLPFDV